MPPTPPMRPVRCVGGAECGLTVMLPRRFDRPSSGLRSPCRPVVAIASELRRGSDPAAVCLPGALDAVLSSEWATRTGTLTPRSRCSETPQIIRHHCCRQVTDRAGHGPDRSCTVGHIDRLHLTAGERRLPRAKAGPCRGCRWPSASVIGPRVRLSVTMFRRILTGSCDGSHRVVSSRYEGTEHVSMYPDLDEEDLRWMHIDSADVTRCG